MAELHQVIGSILRDIAQARISSDIYSRNMSKYYEQDPMLRRFPTPRTEIDEVEIDLKFTVAGMQRDPSQDESRESMAADVFVKVSDRIAHAFFDALLATIGRLVSEAKIAPVDEATMRKVRGTEHRIYLQQDILNYFQRQRGRLKKKIQDGRALKELKVRIFDRRFDQFDPAQLSEREQQWARSILFQDSTAEAEELEKLNQRVFKDSFGATLQGLLDSLHGPLDFVWADDGDQRVSVEVMADKLRETPEALISTIKLKANVQNYIWTKVEHEGRQWRSLNPQ
jgi:hypothetical protein